MTPLTLLRRTGAFGKGARPIRARPAGFAAVSALCVFILALTSCPSPMDDAVVSQLTDETAPLVSIDSPANNSAYTQTVTVQGMVSDGGGKIRSLTYVVTGTLGDLFTGNVPLAGIGTDGSFGFQFSTVGIDGPIVVTVTAVDWNDNAGQKSVVLTYPGSALSSFTATPGNKTVTLDWEPVPGATAYTIYYTSNGTPPSQTYGQSFTAVTPPYVLTGLKNGAVHTFLLRAQTAIAEYWSGYVQAIPLSQFTLAPMVAGGYREIRVEWSGIEGTDEFELYRATDPSGLYVNHTGIMSGTEFTDTNVDDNVWYYYKVKPALAGSSLSTFNGAKTLLIPTQENRITDCITPYTASKVKVVGNYAYVAAGADGLMVIDVTDKSAPLYVTTHATTNARDLAYYTNGANSYIFIADGVGGVRVADITTPSAPVLLSNPYIGLNAKTISIPTGQPSGSQRAFVLDESGDTRILALNITNPGAMTLTDDYADPVYRYQDLDVIYTGSYNYLSATARNTSTFASELHDFYLLNPPNSSIITKLHASLVDPDYNPALVALAGNYAYVLAVRNVDIEPPPEYLLMVVNRSNLTEAGRSYETSGSVSDIKVSGSKVYTADGIGVQTYDVSTAASPRRYEYLNTLGTPTGVDVSGSYEYIASGTRLFQTIDLTSAASPAIEGTWGGSGVGIDGIAVKGNFAYAAATGPSRIQVLDLSNPAAPVPRGSAAATGPKDVAVSGNFAFVADGGGGLKVIDIQDPLSLPPPVGQAASASGNLNGIAVKGDYAYCAGNKGFEVFEISDPAHPVWVGFADAEGMNMTDVALRGRFAYVTDGTYFQPNSLKIIDVSDPAAPVVAAKAVTSGVILSHVSLSGDWAYVSDEGPGTGLWAVNINPDSGLYLKTYGPCNGSPDGWGNACGVAAHGDYAFLSDDASGFAVVNISNPAALSNASLDKTLSLGATMFGAAEVVLDGKYALVSHTVYGLYVIRLF